MGGTDFSVLPRSTGQAQDPMALEQRGVDSEGLGFWNSNEFPVWNLEVLQSQEFQGAVVPEFWREFGWVLPSRNLCLGNWLLTGGWMICFLSAHLSETGGGGWWDGGVHPPVPGAWMLAPSRALPTPSLVECSQAPGPSSVCSSITACPTLFLLLARHPSLNDSSPGLPSLPVPMPRAHPACPGGLLTADRLGPESLMCHCQAREQPCRASVFPSTKWG